MLRKQIIFSDFCKLYPQHSEDPCDGYSTVFSLRPALVVPAILSKLGRTTKLALTAWKVFTVKPHVLQAVILILVACKMLLLFYSYDILSEVEIFHCYKSITTYDSGIIDLGILTLKLEYVSYQC